MQKLHIRNITTVFNFQLVLTVFLLLSLQACVAEQEDDIKKIFPLDPLLGDWQGTQKFPDGKEIPLVAQVIVYKSGRYQANLLRRFDVRESALVILEGKAEDGNISFSGESMDGTKWEGKIVNLKFSGHYDGEKSGQFVMNKVERLSPNLDKKPPKNAVILFNGTNLDNWEHHKDAPGYINLRRFIKAENCSAYLLTEVWSDTPIETVLHLGSNDGIKAWLNDKEIVSHNISRGAEPGQEKVNVKLDEGWNTLMLYITNAGGSWGAFARFFDRAGNILSTISERDWTDEVSRVSKSLEDNDFYLMNWKVAGPYKKEGMGAEQLFETSFQPEQNDKSNVEWKIIDFTQVDYYPKWQVKNSSMEVLPGSGSIVSRQKFKDFRLHIEFRSPFMPRATGQARGNSGVYLQERYEVQVLDSYGLSGEDNECGGIYKIAKPHVNMCAPPMQWQTYDIIFKAPRFNKQGEKIANARLTVNHNGVLIHNDIEIPGPTGGAKENAIKQSGGIMLQDHGDLVQYRNIWLVESLD